MDFTGIWLISMKLYIHCSFLGWAELSYLLSEPRIALAKTYLTLKFGSQISFNAKLTWTVAESSVITSSHLLLPG
jgi:hypothetical protein